MAKHYLCRIQAIGSGIRVSATKVDLMPMEPIPERLKNSEDLALGHCQPILARLKEHGFFDVLNDDELKGCGRDA